MRVLFDFVGLFCTETCALLNGVPSTSLQVLLESKSVYRVNSKLRKNPSVHYKLRDNLRDRFPSTFDLSIMVLAMFLKAVTSVSFLSERKEGLSTLMQECHDERGMEEKRQLY